MWTRREQRWRDALLHSVLPGLDGPDTRASWDQLLDAAPPDIRTNFRAAVVLLVFAPVVVLGRLTTFGRLSIADRDRYLVLALKHRIYLLRQATSALKLVACLTLLREDAVVG